ncbi:response regulator [Amphibacillus sp. MSJ-3]|uniref:response regulator transcription factor n=1 Tax=Amphibacillus sp. MSJ-3 TaxID=2841505 RepID=UPI001C0EE364|nr:helix-turn-helix domain-containing protein [Amphibacillus sp. MSJ-3]MBU5594324.1 response regulator [Amphibacillus sp. MSJ-3]
MYKVFIVEDEPLIRDNLRNEMMRLAKQLPITYAGEASDGELALASIIDIKPDILITDIRMPFMDGLELANEAKKIYPWIRLLFISGFDDFSYAKSALQLQAEDYLLKPIKSKELEQTLRKITESLEERKDQFSVKDENEESLTQEVHKNLFLNCLFKGDLKMNEVIEESNNFQKTIVGKKISVILATNHYNKSFEDYFHFSEKLNFSFGDDEEILFSSISSRYIKILVFHYDYNTLLDKCYQVAHTLLHELDIDSSDLVVGIGPIIDRISEIPYSYEMAKQLIGTYGIIRSEKIISFVDNLKEGEVSPTNPFKIDLADKITSISVENMDAFIESLNGSQFDTIARQRMFRFFVLLEINALILKKQEGKDAPVYQIEDSQEMNQIAKSLDRYTNYLKDTLTYFLEVEIHPSMVKYRSIIQKALLYMDESFSDPDMSLNTVAEIVNLSPSHFSTIFSQSLGQTFIDYLTEQRINKAKHLLATTNDKLTAIALEIGYNDSNYFSYLFKKKEGLSPTEYRKQMRKRPVHFKDKPS